MTGKTHVSVAMAATLLITQPQSIKELVLCLGVTSVGAVISDIDVSTSGSHEAIDRILGIVIIAAIALGFVEYKWNVGIVTSFKNNSSIMRIIVGIVVFLGICIFGKNQPHRSFMHSALAVGLLSGATYIILPDAVPYMFVSMVSHILIDTLNKKKVHIFYPLPWGISFNLCHAQGFVNNTIFKIASILTIISLVYFTGKIGLGFLR
jgi:inner membrane protein